VATSTTDCIVVVEHTTVRGLSLEPWKRWKKYSALDKKNHAAAPSAIAVDRLFTTRKEQKKKKGRQCTITYNPETIFVSFKPDISNGSPRVETHTSKELTRLDRKHGQWRQEEEEEDNTTNNPFSFLFFALAAERKLDSQAGLTFSFYVLNRYIIQYFFCWNNPNFKPLTASELYRLQTSNICIDIISMRSN